MLPTEKFTGVSMGLKSYRELDAWQKAMDVVEAVYRLTGDFPPHEKYGLASQAQRAAVSIPANIAEGYGRKHRGDYLHHLSISSGSLAELETHLTIAARLNYVSRESVLSIWNQTQEAGRLLTKLVQSLQPKRK